MNHNLCLIVCLGLAARVFAADGLDATTDNAPPHIKGINITVLQGEGVVNLLPAAPATNITIRVSDNDGQPIKNAVAVFQMPESGPGATIDSDALTTKAVLTDGSGQAGVITHANSLPGAYQPRVTVNALGQTNAMILHQENRAASEQQTPHQSFLSNSRSPHKGFLHSKAFWITVAGAGAGAAIMLARGHHASTSGNNGSGNGGISITPGSGTVTGGGN